MQPERQGWVISLELPILWIRILLTLLSAGLGVGPAEPKRWHAGRKAGVGSSLWCRGSSCGAKSAATQLRELRGRQENKRRGHRTARLDLAGNMWADCDNKAFEIVQRTEAAVTRVVDTAVCL